MNFDYINKGRVAFWILLGFLVFLIIKMTDLALMVFAGFVIGCSLLPLVNKLSKKINRNFATILVMSFSVLIVAICFFPIISLAINEIKVFLTNLPENYSKINTFMMTSKFFGIKLSEYWTTTPDLTQVNNVATEVINRSLNITSAFVSSITIGFALAMIVFYFLAENNYIEDRFIALFPPKYSKRAKYILNLVKTRVGGYVIAQSSTMLCVGIINFIGLACLNVKYALLLGIIAGLFDIIPVIGPIFATLIAMLVAIPQGWIVLILIIILHVVGQWVSNNMLRPFIFAKFLNLHPLTIIVSFLIAAKFLGVWGIILAPAMASVITTLIDELYIKAIHKEE